MVAKEAERHSTTTVTVEERQTLALRFFAFWRWLIVRHGGALVVFTAVYLAVSWPLALHFSDSIIGAVKSDGWLEVEQFWWYKHSLIDLHISPFFDSQFFYPAGWNTLTGSHSPSLIIPTIPLTVIFGPIMAYNMVMALGFLLAAVGTYALVYRLTRDRLAGTLSGIAYAFTMTRLFRIGGHINVLVGSAWIPWVFFCIEMGRMAENGRKQTRWFILAGVFYAAAVLSYFYYIYIVAIPLAAYLLWYVWQQRGERNRLSRSLKHSVWLFGAAAVLVTPFALPVLLLRRQMAIEAYPLEATVSFGISPDRLLLPNLFHPLWGQWFAARFSHAGEQTAIFLGLTAVFLFILAFFRPVHARRTGYALVALAAFVAGLGPELHWNAQSLGIPMPGLLLFRYVPFYSVIRVWARFSIVISFAVAVVAGFSVAYFRPRWRWGTAVSLLLLGFVILESFGQPFPVVSSQTMEREVDFWLAEQPEGTAILELPLNYRINGSLHYSRMLHNQANVSGYAVAMPEPFRDNVANFSTFPNQETVQVLSEWGVDYLLYSTTNVAEFTAVTLPQIEALSGLSLVADFGGHAYERVFVFAID